MNIRKLVVNADDLGLTPGVNDGIFDAHVHGILTSASLFAQAPATADAVHRARRLPSLGIGVHLTLVDGAPVLPASRVPSLLEDDGRFRRSWKSFIVACLRERVALDEVERELAAQVDRVRSEGIPLTHLDAHKHVHAYPPIFTIVVGLARRFGIAVVRVPFEHPVPSVADLAMRPWLRRDYRVAADYGITTPRFVGRAFTGTLTAPALDDAIRRVPAGTTELMVHPGYVDDALRAMPTRLVASRAKEVALLTAPDVHRLVAAEGIQLVRHDLAPARRSSRSFRYVS